MNVSHISVSGYCSIRLEMI